MEPLNGYSGFIGMFAAAIISGAIGGFVFELMPGNSNVHIGLLKIPGGSKTGGNSNSVRNLLTFTIGQRTLIEYISHKWCEQTVEIIRHGTQPVLGYFPE